MAVSCRGTSGEERAGEYARPGSGEKLRRRGRETALETLSEEPGGVAVVSRFVSEPSEAPGAGSLMGDRGEADGTTEDGGGGFERACSRTGVPGCATRMGVGGRDEAEDSDGSQR